MQVLILTLFVGIIYPAHSAVTGRVSGKILEIDEEFFDDELVVYTAQHEIVNMFVPINALNFNDDDEDENISLFFVQADINNGQKDYKGLYLLRGQNATKLLDNGRDFSANNDDGTTVYFGASDGIYTYNPTKNTAEKYGSVTDSVKSIAKENGTDVVYIVTDENELYKVSAEGNKKEKMSDIPQAEEITLDYFNNLYYYGADKQPYVVKVDGVKKIEGLPENPKDVRLLKPLFILPDAVPIIIDNEPYMIFSNGTSENFDVHLKLKPTAYSAEAVLIQYYAYNKKIYEYNILALVIGETMDNIKDFFSDKTDSITSLATRSRSDLRNF